MPTTLTLQPTGQVLTVPTSWADVTLGQYVALHAPDPQDQRTAAELLLGLEAGALNRLAAADVVYLSTLLAFATDPSPVLALLPTPGLPDVGTLPWGCLVLVQEHFRDEAYDGRPDLAHLPYVLAVYRCQLSWGNTGKVEQLEQALLASPVTECYADAAFFLAAARRSLSGTSPTPNATTTTPTKKSWMPAARSWLSGLGLRFRSTP